MLGALAAWTEDGRLVEIREAKVRALLADLLLSLDDLAVGLALGTVRYPIVLAVALFGLMSFVMSVIGLKLGAKLGMAAGEHGEVAGAIVLIGIAGAMAMGWLLPRPAAAAPPHLTSRLS